jgi:hypothetical protein
MADNEKVNVPVSTAFSSEKESQTLAPVLSDSIEDNDIIEESKHEKALVRKLDRHLLPVLTLLYLLSFLDRSNGLLHVLHCGKYSRTDVLNSWKCASRRAY